jgi:hypothetical protein
LVSIADVVSGHGDALQRDGTVRLSRLRPFRMATARSSHHQGSG